MASIDFNSKKTVIKTVANGIIRFIIPTTLYNLEPKDCSLQIRTEWYRKLLGIDNVLFFSENVGEDGEIVGESLVVLDIIKSEYSPTKTKLNFAENGHTGKYTTPIINIEAIPFGMLVSFGEILKQIKNENKGAIGQ